jgi:indole-3-glycerol phosphate synthase
VTDFYAKLRGVEGMAVLAEIKRASPSKAWIAPEIVAEAQGRIYAEAGAVAISVLCEPHWFKGSLADLASVRAAVDGLGERRPALVRKDFLLDEYQLWEARLHGADTVLLIVAILDAAQLTELIVVARSLCAHCLICPPCPSVNACTHLRLHALNVCFRGMEPLVEVANAPEMARARALGARVIGINNRNLHDFSVDMGTSTALTAGLDMGEDTIFLALSGISGPESVLPYREAGLHGVLVGEALMRAADPAEALAALRNAAPTDAAAAAASPVSGDTPATL